MLTLINEWKIGFLLIYWAFFRPSTAHIRIKQDLVKRLGFDLNRQKNLGYKARFILRYTLQILCVFIFCLVVFTYGIRFIETARGINTIDWRTFQILGTFGFILFLIEILLLFPSYSIITTAKISASLGIGILATSTVTPLFGNSQLSWCLCLAFLGLSASPLFAFLIAKQEFVSVISIALGILGVGISEAWDMNSIYPILIAGSFLLGMSRFCLWFLELTLCISLYLLSRFSQFKIPISLIPTSFDEAILLPLPFLPYLIAKSYKHQPEQAIAHIKYLDTYTFQTKVALNSLTLILVTELEKGKTMANIVDIAEATQWLPEGLESRYDYDSVINDLVDIARDIHYLKRTYSLYYATHISRKILNDLPNIQRKLSKSKSIYRPRLRQITQTWLKLIGVAHKNYSQQFANSFEIPPVYIFKDILNPIHTGHCFKGRAECLETINQIVLQQKSSIIWLRGTQKIGKSSLLNFLPERLEQRILPILIDFRGVAIAAESSNLIEEFARRMINFLKERFGLEAPFLGRQQLLNNPLATLDYWFTEIEQLKPHTNFLICLDVYDDLGELPPAITAQLLMFPSLLKSLITDNQRWSLLLSGHKLYGEITSVWQPLLDAAHNISLGYLSPSEAIDLIRAPIPDFPDIYAETAIDALLYWTNSHPYLIQLMAGILVNEMNHGIPEPSNYQVTALEIDRLMPIVLDYATPFFEDVWSGTLSERQQTYLQQLILDTHLANVDSTEIQRLIEKGILSAAAGKYRFQIPLFEEYCRRQIDAQDNHKQDNNKNEQDI